jgi:hypothetical protein
VAYAMPAPLGTSASAPGDTHSRKADVPALTSQLDGTIPVSALRTLFGFLKCEWAGGLRGKCGPRSTHAVHAQVSFPHALLSCGHRRAYGSPGTDLECTSTCTLYDILLLCPPGQCSAVQILAVLNRMDLLDYDKVASYVASLQQVSPVSLLVC